MPAPGTAAGAIFLGITPPPFRDYLTEFLTAARERYERLTVPCVGRFTIPLLAIGAGWDAHRIRCSDISLFSAVVGAAATDQDFAGLGVELTDAPELAFLTDWFDGSMRQGAATLFALKYLAAPDKSYYDRTFLDDMLANAPEYLDSMTRQLEHFAEKLAGIQYASADMWDEVRPDDEAAGTVLFVNPPAYAKGYEKMFDTAGRLTWRAPEAAQYEPRKDYLRLFHGLADHPGLALMYKAGGLEEVPPSAAIFGTAVHGERNDYLVTNQPAVATALHRIGAENIRPIKIEPSKFPIITDDDPITADSVIQYVPTHRGVALYYRDLFAHKMGSTSAGLSILGLIDGRIFVVCGFNPGQMRGRPSAFTEYMWEQYGFSPPSKRRLQRLFMASMCTTAFRAVLNSLTSPGLSGQAGIATTCITPYPELKINRGIMEIKQREKLPDGNFRLLYEQEYREATFEQILKEWLAGEAKRGSK